MRTRMSMTPEAFVAKYKNIRVNERAGAQMHFLDLCALLIVPTPSGGHDYRFEKPVLKVAGGSGFADAWWRDHFGWEYKGVGADLRKAYQQLLSYREDLDNPPLLMVSDMQVIELHTNFTGTQKVVHRWELDDLLSELRRNELRQAWTDPQAFNPAHQIELATVAAVESLAKVSDSLKERGENAERVAHFLVRIMFTLFAEDVELIPAATFTRLLAAARKHPEDFQEMCTELFEAMKVGKTTVVGRIPHINGGVFDDSTAPALTGEEIARLYDASKRSWKQIDPTIFGSLFELVIDPRKRWQLGAHYTPLADILDVVEPVIMRPLRLEWEALRTELQPLLHEIELAHQQQGGGLYADGGLGEASTIHAAGRLRDFQRRLANVTVLDPAMGSGNFLYVTLRLLLDLEAEVRETLRMVTQDITPPPSVHPQQMLGMEINPYAHEIANMVLWIGYLQWMREHQEVVKVTPVLERLPGLVCRDAVYDLTSGQSKEWPAAEFIVGNPPFLGYSPMREQLGSAYVDGLRAAFKDRIAGFSDFVCYFFEKARENVELGRTKRVGLIATNSIAGGENARVLERILKTGAIFRAWPDRAWIQSGAAVRTSVVMFDGGQEPERVLLRHEGDERDPNKRVTVARDVPTINGDLSSGPALRSAKSLTSNAGKAFIGALPGAKGFILSGQEARAWFDLPNPEGVSNRDVLKPFKVGEDLNDVDSDRYAIDFSGMELEDARKYEEPMARVLALVKPEKDKTNERHSRERWWQFKRSSPNLRSALSGKPRFLATSAVSKHRTFTWLSSDDLPANTVVAVAVADDFTHGVLNSFFHTAWAGRLGTALEDRPRYTPSTTFETFPFPEPTPDQREDIEQAARHLETMRAHLKAQRAPGRHTDRSKTDSQKTLTLTGIYNLLAEFRQSGVETVIGIRALERAHLALDAAVAAAYGWNWPMDEDELLTGLLELNLARAASGV